MDQRAAVHSLCHVQACAYLVQLREAGGDHIGIDPLVNHECQRVGCILYVGVSVKRSAECA